MLESSFVCCEKLFLFFDLLLASACTCGDSCLPLSRLPLSQAACWCSVAPRQGADSWLRGHSRTTWTSLCRKEADCSQFPASPDRRPAHRCFQPCRRSLRCCQSRCNGRPPACSAIVPPAVGCGIASSSCPRIAWPSGHLWWLEVGHSGVSSSALPSNQRSYLLRA